MVAYLFITAYVMAGITYWLAVSPASEHSTGLIHGGQRQQGDSRRQSGTRSESRSFQNGGKVVELRIATSRSWKDRNSGERKEKTEWHTVKIFNEGLANVAERFLRKGSRSISKAR
jgi:hypothetical protein